VPLKITLLIDFIVAINDYKICNRKYGRAEPEEIEAIFSPEKLKFAVF
jgi:hypothetical protein